MTRLQIDIGGVIHTLPINPIEFQQQSTRDFSTEDTIQDSVIIFQPWVDGRKRVMTWRDLPNKAPYTSLYIVLTSGIGISGVKMNLRDLQIVGDISEWQNIRIENVNIQKRKGLGRKSSRSYLSFDLDLVYSLG
jgi:hypothetical protein